MRKTLTLLVASTALTAVGLPVWSAMQAPGDESVRPSAALFEDGAQAQPLILASDDDDRGHLRKSRRGHDDDDDDDDERRGGARNPAPAGAASPPQNGLFGNGARPQVRVN